MQFRAWGDWVGPGYSAGEFVSPSGRLSKHQRRKPAVDHVDAKAKRHDLAYEEVSELAADLEWILSPSEYREPGIVVDSIASLLFAVKSGVGYRNSNYPDPQRSLVGIETNPGPGGGNSASGSFLSPSGSGSIHTTDRPTNVQTQGWSLPWDTDWERLPEYTGGSDQSPGTTWHRPTDRPIATPDGPVLSQQERDKWASFNQMWANIREYNTNARPFYELGDPNSDIQQDVELYLWTTDVHRIYARGQEAQLERDHQIAQRTRGWQLRKHLIEPTPVFDRDAYALSIGLTNGDYLDGHRRPPTIDVEEGSDPTYFTPPPSPVPQPILVGIEPNPGPKNTHKKVAKKKKKQPHAKKHVAKKVVKVVKEVKKHPRPAGGSTGERPFVITRREALGPVLSSGTFSANSYAINPGNNRTFPWLSKIAAAFEFYKFRRLAFVYMTTSGQAVSGTNPAIGQVLMATNYDPVDVQFTSATQMENYDGCVRGIASANCSHIVDLGARKLGSAPVKERYVLVGDQPYGTDIRFYDVGTMTIATQGEPATGNQVGELFVMYEIELYKPKDETPFGQTLPSAHMWTVGANNIYPFAHFAGDRYLSGALPGVEFIADIDGRMFFSWKQHGRFYVQFKFGKTSGANWTNGAEAYGLSVGASTDALFATQVPNMFHGAANQSRTWQDSVSDLSFYVDTVTNALGVAGFPALSIVGPSNGSTWTGWCDVMIFQVSSGLTKPVQVSLEQKIEYLMQQLNERKNASADEHESPYFVTRRIDGEMKSIKR